MWEITTNLVQAMVKKIHMREEHERYYVLSFLPPLSVRKKTAPFSKICLQHIGESILQL